MSLPSSINWESLHAVPPRAMRSSTTSSESRTRCDDLRGSRAPALSPSPLLASYILMICDPSAEIISLHHVHAGVSQYTWSRKTFTRVNEKRATGHRSMWSKAHTQTRCESRKELCHELAA